MGDETFRDLSPLRRDDSVGVGSANYPLQLIGSIPSPFADRCIGLGPQDNPDRKIDGTTSWSSSPEREGGPTTETDPSASPDSSLAPAPSASTPPPFADALRDRQLGDAMLLPAAVPLPGLASGAARGVMSKTAAAPPRGRAPRGKKRRAPKRAGAEQDQAKREPTDQDKPSEAVGKLPLGKRERNKMAASKYRKRRKKYVQTLEAKLHGLENTNGAQAEQIEELTASNQLLYHQNLNLLQQVAFLKSFVCVRGSEAANMCGKVLKKPATLGGLGMLATIMTLSLVILSEPAAVHRMSPHGNHSPTKLQQVDSRAALRSAPAAAEFQAQIKLGAAVRGAAGRAPMPAKARRRSAAKPVADRSNTMENFPPRLKQTESNLRVLGEIVDRWGAGPTEQLQERDVSKLGQRTEFLAQEKFNVTQAGLSLEQMLNLPDKVFCQKLSCSSQALKRLAGLKAHWVLS